MESLAKWPKPEKALKAVLDAFDLTKAGRNGVYGEAATTAASIKEFERFLAGGFADVEKGDALLMGSIDALLRELSGQGIDDIVGVRPGLANLEQRYMALRAKVPVMWASQTAVDWFVLSRLLVPWAAALAAGSVSNGLPFDDGMPGGRFWFLPDHVEGRTVMPLNRLFDWWRDLCRFQSRAQLVNEIEKVAGGSGREGLEAEVSEWVSAKRALPTLSRINRLAAAAEQLGRSKDCEDLDLDGDLGERLVRCVRFFEARGHTPETLSFEIPTKPRAIAEIQEAVAQGRSPRLPSEVCERFVAHMRRRWRAPTRAEVRSRLLLARGAQRLFMGWQERFGEQKALGLCGIFHAAYNVFMELLLMERQEGEKALARHVAALDSGPLLGVLRPPDSGDFIDLAIAYVTGCPERYELDPVPVLGMDDRERALYLGGHIVWRVVDLCRDLQLRPPADLTGVVAGNADAVQEFERFRATASRLMDVVGEKDLAALWLAYVSLPNDLPPSAVHVTVARRIVDGVGDFSTKPDWRARFLRALERSQDEMLGDVLRAQGLGLEAWWLTAPHRPKAPGDLERARDVLCCLNDMALGWMHYEIQWRQARLLAQSGSLKGAVVAYEDILANGGSNISREMEEVCWEALACSAAAGKFGKFRSMRKLAAKHVWMVGLMGEAHARQQAEQVWRDEFAHPYPRTQCSLLRS